MTSLKVAVRVRPLTEKESDLGSNVVVDVCGKDIIVTDVKVPENRGCDHRVRVHRFTFDYGFWSVDPQSTKCASQKTVYEEFGRVVLNTLLEGYNSCVIAYGPSGSGKTYTMMGTKEENGLTPRICEGLFKKLTDQADNHLPFQIDISFMEIYNEQVFDLLQKDETASVKKSKLRVREHPIHGPFVEGLTTHIVSNIGRVCDLLARGNENRMKAATHVHDRSTRSHAIFTIRCSQACLDESKPREVISKLHLVDLAGSEKAAPEFCYERVKEGGNINKSLVTLGNVISVLVEMSQKAKTATPSQKRTFVPYRDSNLTWLLKDSLGGNSHTFMLAAVSPSRECYIETVSTLRYAQRAQFVMNKPVVNEDPGTEMIRNLKTEVMRLKNLLCTAEKLNRAYILKPLPEILQLRKVMEESAKRVDALTKHWFEKWMKTYNVVVNKALDQVPHQSRIQNPDIWKSRDPLLNQTVSKKWSPTLPTVSSSMSSDSVECVIMRNGTVGFSKKKHNISRSEQLCSDTPRDSSNESHIQLNDSHEIPFLENSSFRSRSPVRSYSDTSLRRITSSALTPLFKFLSLSETNARFPPCTYSWLTSTQAADTSLSKKHPKISDKTLPEYIESKETKIFDKKICELQSSEISMVEFVTHGVETKNSDTFSCVCDKFDSESVSIKQSFTHDNEALPVVEPSSDGVCLMHEELDHAEQSSLSSSVIHCEKERSVSYSKNEILDSLDSLREQDYKQDLDRSILHLTQPCNPSEKGTGKSLNQEFKFGEQVIEESKNLLEYLRKIGPESTESSSGCCSPRRKDSEIISLLSFSSLDVPYFRSLDDLSSNDENESGSKKEKQTTLESEIEKAQRNPGESQKELENPKVDTQQSGTLEEEIITDKENGLNSDRRYCVENISERDNSLPLMSIIGNEMNELEIVFDSKSKSRDPCFPIFRFGKSYQEPLFNGNDIKRCEFDFNLKSDKVSQFEISCQKQHSQKDKSLENIVQQMEEREYQRPPMKLTKANLDLLAEELSGETQESNNYINACMAYTQNLICQENSESVHENVGTETVTAVEKTDTEAELSKEQVPRLSLKPERSRKIYDFGCWGKEYSSKVEQKMKKVEDEMKEIEIILGKQLGSTTAEEKATTPSLIEGNLDRRSSENLKNSCNLGQPRYDLEFRSDIESENLRNKSENNSKNSSANDLLEFVPVVATIDCVNDVLHENEQNEANNALTPIPEEGIKSLEQGLDGDSDFNDTFTLDSLDNFEAEMKAWAEKYLTKYESQSSTFSTSDKVNHWDKNESVLNEVELSSRCTAQSHNEVNEIENDFVANNLNNNFHLPVVKSLCSVDSSSSDSITYVFVGKDESDVQKAPPLFKSHGSSLLSSVSLDSLERTSLQQKTSFMSPRTLSIDSLVAEDLLEQLKKGRLPSGMKLFRDDSKAGLIGKGNGKLEKTRFTEILPDCANLLSQIEQINSEKSNVTSIEADCSDHPFRTMHHVPYNNLSWSEKATERQLICSEQSSSLCFQRENGHDRSVDEENSLNYDYGECENVQNNVVNGKQATLPHDKLQMKCIDSPYWEQVSCPVSDVGICPAICDMALQENEISHPLATILIPPPSSFAKAENVLSAFNLCHSRESNDDKNQRVSKSTQTDDLFEPEKSFGKPTTFDANYLDLTSRMIELMTETIKYLKDQKHNSHSCCHSHHKSCRHRVVSPSSDSDSASESFKLPSFSHERNRKRNDKQKSVPIRYGTLGKQTERAKRKLCLTHVTANKPSSECQDVETACNVKADSCPMNDNFNYHERLYSSIAKKASRTFRAIETKGINSITSHEIELDRDYSKTRNTRDVTPLHLNYCHSVEPNISDEKNQSVIPQLVTSVNHQELAPISPKNHLQHLLEIRRRVVEETMQNKDEKITDEKKTDLVAEVINNRRCSTSSSSEGYLSSVSSRGIVSHLSETATDSGALENQSKADSKLFTPSANINRTRPKLLEVRRSGQSYGTPSTSWQNTSADSGAFFMDSPLAERNDILEIDQFENCVTTVGSRCPQPTKESNFYELVKNTLAVEDRTHDNKKLKNGPSVPTRILEETIPSPFSNAVRRNQSPKLNLLEEFRQSKTAEFTSEIRKARLSGSSGFRESHEFRDLDPVDDSRSELIKKLADVNYKVTRKDIESILASVEADKAFLRRRRNPLLDKRFSPRVSLCSMIGSEDDLFPWDSYKRLPDQSLFIGTSA